jgi:hypothetical protein
LYLNISRVPVSANGSIVGRFDSSIVLNTFKVSGYEALEKNAAPNGWKMPLEAWSAVSKMLAPHAIDHLLLIIISLTFASNLRLAIEDNSFDAFALESGG